MLITANGPRNANSGRSTSWRTIFNAQKRLIVSIEHLKVIGGSSLTDTSIPVPESGSAPRKPDSPLSAPNIPSTYVPFRNAHLLAIAVSWSEVIDAKKIFIGAVEEDSSGYPDCREVFYQAFNRVIETGTRPETRVDIVTPLIHMKKSEIVRKGLALGAPFELTWSCYQDSEKACGRCESCALRLKGFREAGNEGSRYRMRTAAPDRLEEASNDKEQRQARP